MDRPIRIDNTIVGRGGHSGRSSDPRFPSTSGRPHPIGPERWCQLDEAPLAARVSTPGVRVRSDVYFRSDVKAERRAALC